MTNSATSIFSTEQAVRFNQRTSKQVLTAFTPAEISTHSSSFKGFICPIEVHIVQNLNWPLCHVQQQLCHMGKSGPYHSWFWNDLHLMHHSGKRGPAWGNLTRFELCLTVKSASWALRVWGSPRWAAIPPVSQHSERIGPGPSLAGIQVEGWVTEIIRLNNLNSALHHLLTKMVTWMKKEEEESN